MAINEVAANAGIRTGCSVESALVSIPALQICPRNPSREEAWLHERTIRALAFTPIVSVSGQSLLLEIGGSERLFGGRARLFDRVQAALVSDAACFCAGAPTALAALCLARGGVTGCMETDFQKQFAVLPLSVLPISRATLQKLKDLGLRQTGECLRLPREGLARRFPELPDLFDRVYGKIADPQLPYRLAQRFEERMDLATPARTWSELQPAVDHLLSGLERMLRRHMACVDCLDLEFGHRRVDPTSLKLRFARPQVGARGLSILCRERIQAEQLPEAVESIRLRTAAFLPDHGSAGYLFPEGGEVEGDLLDRLRMRLGDRIRGLAQTDEHRPERTFGDPVSGTESRGAAARAPRPLWLLRIPRRLSVRLGRPWYQGRSLCLREGPERIESGWWDGGDVARDYFIAQDICGTKLWIFNDLRDRQWFLQGIFA